MEKKLSFLLVIIMTIVSGCAVNTGKVYTAKKDIFAMDTYMSLTVYGDDADAAINDSIEEIKRLDNLLSTGSETSEVSLINKNHGGVLSEDTAYLMTKSNEIFEDTHGAFDVTIYPLMKAWGFAGGENRVPSENEIEGLLSAVDLSQIEYDENSKQISMPDGFSLDFGGIAKGYTSSCVAKIIKENEKIVGAWINLGGNVQLVGTKPDGSLFKVGIKNPSNDGSYLGVIETTDVAIITSGGYERFFEQDGIKYHHIIDPDTGYPANNGLASVTVVCKDGSLADGYSTALFVLGKDGAVEYWKEHRDEFQMVLLTDSDELLISKGLADKFTSNHKFAVID